MSSKQILLLQCLRFRVIRWDLGFAGFEMQDLGMEKKVYRKKDLL